MLGSPDWETDMQRRLADHVWRERYASRSAGSQHNHHNQFRHSWHAAADTRRNSRLSARSGGSRADAGTERRAYSARIPYVSSFGEIGLESIARRRPNSYNEVYGGKENNCRTLDPLVFSGGSQLRTQDQTTPELDGQTATNQVHQYPALCEVSSPSSSTITEYGTARTSLRIHVTDYSDDGPARPPSAHIPSGSVESNINSVTTSSPYAGHSLSEASSAVSSWGQLPNFPSPPLSSGSPILASPVTPSPPNVITINTALVAPYVFDKENYTDESGLFSGKPLTGLGLTDERNKGVSEVYPIKEGAAESQSSSMDFGWPYTAFSSCLSLPLPASSQDSLGPAQVDSEEAIEAATTGSSKWKKEK